MKHWFWLLALATSVSADTIRLKNGTVLEGAIIAETASNLTLEVRLARGTIVQSQVVPLADVANVTRWTPEQQRALALQTEYAALAKYVLHPGTSASLAACDQAIGALQKFLATFPGSAHEPELRDRLTQWQTERQQIAAGMVKKGGTWLSKEEGAKQQLRAQADALVEQGQAVFTAKRWAQAVQIYDALLALHPGGVTEALAKQRVTEALTGWRGELEPQLKQLEGELASAQQRLEQAQRVQKSILQSQSKFNSSPNSGKLGGDGGNLLRAQGELTFAESQLKTIRPQVEKSRAQLAEINRRLAPPPVPDPVARDAAPPSTGVLQDTAAWWEKYWPILTGVALGALWLLSRLLRR